MRQPFIGQQLGRVVPALRRQRWLQHQVRGCRRPLQTTGVARRCDLIHTPRMASNWLRGPCTFETVQAANAGSSEQHGTVNQYEVTALDLTTRRKCRLMLRVMPRVAHATRPTVRLYSTCVLFLARMVMPAAWRWRSLESILRSFPPRLVRLPNMALTVVDAHDRRDVLLTLHYSSGSLFMQFFA